MTAHEKIKEMRIKLGLKQSEFASILGIHQRDISKLENGQKKFIPNEYLEYFAKKGFDLNSLFDDKIPLRKIDNEKNTAQEPRGAYGLNSDEKLINQIIEKLGLKDKAHLIDYFEQFNENHSLFELAVVNAFEKNYGVTWKAMQYQLERYLEDDLTNSKESNNKKQGRKKSS